MSLSAIEESYKVVYGPIAKVIGECLLGLQNVAVDATAVICAIIAVAIDLAAKANALANKNVIDVNHLARFTAFTLTNTFSLSPEVRAALDAVALAGLSAPDSSSN